MSPAPARLPTLMLERLFFHSVPPSRGQSRKTSEASSNRKPGTAILYTLTVADDRGFRGKLRIRSREK